MVIVMLTFASFIAACSLTTPAGNVDGAAGSNQGEKVTLGLTYIPNVQFSPVYVAEDDAIYQAAGINMTVRHHGGEEGLFTALTSGDEDIVLASGDEVFQARDKGINLVSIASYYSSYPVTLIVKEGSPIRSIADLEGKRVGIPGEYGSSWFALLAMLEQAGMKKSDITTVSIGYTQQAALAGGEVDAIVGFTNNELVNFTESGMAVRQVSPKEELPLVSASLITTRSWLDAHPQEAQAVVAATRSGIERVIENPQRAIEATQARDATMTSPEQVASARAVLTATMTLFARDNGRVSLVQDASQWEEMANFQARIPHLLTDPPDAAEAMTNEVVKEK